MTICFLWCGGLSHPHRWGVVAPLSVGSRCVGCGFGVVMVLGGGGVDSLGAPGAADEDSVGFGGYMGHPDFFGDSGGGDVVGAAAGFDDVTLPTGKSCGEGVPAGFGGYPLGPHAAGDDAP